MSVGAFEQAFAQAEAAAAAAHKAGGAVLRHARAMEKAAQQGHIAAIKRAQGALADSLRTLTQEVHNAASCWPLTEDEENAHLATAYAAELRAAAHELGLRIHERDGLMISYPSLVRVLPAERAVRIDRKKVPTIRPSHLAALLLKNQNKTSGFTSGRFIESLYRIYAALTREDQAKELIPGGRVVPLARIYDLLTALPGSSRDYDRSDFARDLYALDAGGPKATRNGATVSFPASTGTRRRTRDIFSFVGPHGDVVDYYGIRFS